MRGFARQPFGASSVLTNYHYINQLEAIFSDSSRNLAKMRVHPGRGEQIAIAGQEHWRTGNPPDIPASDKISLMRVRCTHCGAQIELEDALIARRRMVQRQCWMCGRSSVFDVSKPDPAMSTISADPMAPLERSVGALRLDSSLSPQTVTLDLPQNKVITIYVIAGASEGVEHHLTMPLVTIGRRGGGADIEIDDPQVSRLHCAVEVKNEAVFLRDLRSTNGTYMSEKRILAVPLEHMSEFRIGVSTLRVSILPA